MANRNYRLYTHGAIPSLLGTWIQRMAMGWLAWELTKSGTWLGLVAFADLAPTVITAPIAGAFADRVDRLKMVRLIQYANIVQATALAVRFQFLPPPMTTPVIPSNFLGATVAISTPRPLPAILLATTPLHSRLLVSVHAQAQSCALILLPTASRAVPTRSTIEYFAESGVGTVRGVAC